jgi:hypothetical protein
MRFSDATAMATSVVCRRDGLFRHYAVGRETQNTSGMSLKG